MVRTAATAALGLVLVLAGAAVAVTPADAAGASRVTLRAPVVRDGSTLLRGTVSGRARAVKVQVRKHGRWKTLDRVRVRHHRFRTRVATTVDATAVRVGLAGRYSAARRLPAPTKTSTPAPPPNDACGPRPVKADGSLWSCTFVDDFSGTSLDRTKWLPQQGFPTGVDGARACAVDDGTTIQVANGVLDLSVRKLAEPMMCSSGSGPKEAQYSAATVSTYHLFSQQYGRFEARMKNTATTAPGLQEAFWLWPDDRVASTDIWPVAGEIDISETYSKYYWLSIPFLHYSADALGPQPGVNTAWNCVAQRGVWNTYRLDWTATRLEIYVNGVPCLVNVSGDKAFQKPYIAAFTAALGVTDNAYTGDAPIPATTSVDYIRVWK